MEQTTSNVYLVDVVEVDKSKRIRCQANGCGHAVYARIHIVLDAGNFVVLGGDCFQRIYGENLKGIKSYYGGSACSPTQLTEDMRRLLTVNTIEFVSLLEERRQQIEAETERYRVAQQEAQLKEEITKRSEPVGRNFTQRQTDGGMHPKMDSGWTDFRSADAYHSLETAYSGHYRYVWSSSWWTSAGKLRSAIEETVNSDKHADTLYKAIVAVKRQPTFSPGEFAMQLESNGVPFEVALECLRAVHLVVRAKASSPVDSNLRRNSGI